MLGSLSVDADVQKPRILLVDDEPLLVVTLQVLLSEEYDVEIARSGEEAKDYLERDRDFDAVLCDLMLFGMSGMELHSWVMQEDPALASRMIFMTGGAYTDDAREFLARTANQCIEKPFDPAQLSSLLRLQGARKP